MKRIIAISFLFIFLTANTAFGQLLRLPTLVHHYLEHVESDNSSLVEFLSEHYSKEINHPDDQHHDHQKLPFKTTDCHTSHVVTIVPQLHFFKPAFVSTQQTLTIPNQQHYSNTYLNNIWQPPRFS